MSEPRIESFEDFWPYYVRAHRVPANRLLHAVGTSCALGCVAGAFVTGNPLLLGLAPIVGYGPAWAGHFLIEGNRPATFGHPLYSLQGDFKMLWLTLNGRMDEEVRVHTESRVPAAGEPAAGEQAEEPAARSAAVH